MINKILCFMWGCEPVDTVETITVYRCEYGFYHPPEVYQQIVNKCKHCGAIKNDRS